MENEEIIKISDNNESQKSSENCDENSDLKVESTETITQSKTEVTETIKSDKTGADKKGTLTTKKILLCVFSLLIFFTETAVAAIMIFKESTVFGREVTPLSFINFILSVFKINKATIYHDLMSCVAGVAYIILAIITIKCWIFELYRIFQDITLIKHGESKFKVTSNCQHIIICYLIFFFMCNLMTGESRTEFPRIGLILVLTIPVFNTCIGLILNSSLKNKIFEILKSIALSFSLYMIIITVCSDYFYQSMKIFQNIEVLAQLSGESEYALSYFFNYIAFPVAMLVVAISVLLSVIDWIQISFLFIEKKTIVRLIITFIVVALICLAANASGAYSLNEEIMRVFIEQIHYSVLPCIISLIVAYFLRPTGKGLYSQE